MKQVKFLALLAPVLLGALAGMVACTGDGGDGHGGTITFGHNITTDMDVNVDASWKPCAAPAVTTGDFKVTGPYAHRNLEIYLVHGNDQVKPKREVLTLEEALTQGKAVVHETSTVDQLAVENLSQDADVYVQSGDIVQGGKQDRVLAVDLILSPKSGRVPVASFCVEQGRWGARDGIALGATRQFATARFAVSSNALSSVELKRAVKVAGGQTEVWARVARQQAQLRNNLGAEVCAVVSRSSLQLTLKGEAVETAAKGYTEALAKVVDGKDDVVGFAAAVNGKITSADIYSSNALFQKLWNKLLTASAVEAIAEQREGKKADPVGTEKVTAFLADMDQDKAMSKNVTARVQLLRSEGRSNWFFETRDRGNGTAWLHRNYLPK